MPGNFKFEKTYLAQVLFQVIAAAVALYLKVLSEGRTFVFFVSDFPYFFTRLFQIRFTLTIKPRVQNIWEKILYWHDWHLIFAETIRRIRDENSQQQESEKFLVYSEMFAAKIRKKFPPELLLGSAGWSKSKIQIWFVARSVFTTFIHPAPTARNMFQESSKLSTRDNSNFRLTD